MPRNVRNPLLAALACAVALVVLAVAAYSFGPVRRVDLRVLVHLSTIEGTAHTAAAALVNLGDLGSLLALTAVAAAIGLWFGRRRETLAALVVIAGANLTTQLLKTTLEHARHRAFEHGIELPWPNSFPSGHTTAAASIAVALLFVVPAVHRTAAAAVGAGLTAAVGISVIVLAWHYPSDVLGGLLVVGAWSFAALAYLRLRADRDRAARPGERRRSRHLAVSTD